MDYMERYKSWIENDYFGEDVKKDLDSISDNLKEIEERFYKDLEFGTAGLRGVVGFGTNRMNIYTVGKATQGLSEYVNQTSENDEKTAVISYDGRLMSDVFANIAARVFAANGIKTYLFKGVRPTPVASFAVRELKTDTGIMITASHNPPEYNGYKAYGRDGGQYSTTDSMDITKVFVKIASYESVKMMSEEEAREKGLIVDVPSWVDEKYIKQVLELSLRDDIDKNINIVYTPLHGVGAEKVLKVLKERGFDNIHTVKEQEEPDGNFPTLTYPNPEDLKAFELAKELAYDVDADIIIATDPDTDRVASLVKHEGEYESLSGNQMGYLLMDYVLRERKSKGNLPEDGVLVKTIVSSRFAEKIAEKYGLGFRDVYTGFKNIAKAIREMENDGSGEYVFGYEESIGYLPQTFVRDKDAVSTSMLIAEMAALYKKEGLTLIDKLESIFEEYGYFEEKLYSKIFTGIEGRAKMDKLMEIFRNDYPTEINGSKLVELIDYKTQKSHKGDDVTELDFDEKENAVKYIFDNGSWYVMRPSGTEPKIKVYIYSTSETRDEALEKIEAISSVVDNIIESVDNI